MRVPSVSRARVRTALVGAVAAGLAFTLVPGAGGTASAAGTGIAFGASGGSAVSALSAKIGAPLHQHSFGMLDKSVPSGKLINMKPNVPWRSVAAAQPGSTVYTNITRWADTLKARPGRTMFTFSHEPEGKSSQSAGLGNATEFIAAFRKVHDVFVSRGITNVEYTWNMTSNSYRVPASDPRYAPKWYPGDGYVDNVATAAYNWYTCEEGQGQWLSLASRAEAPLAFARAHGKPYVLAEWASAPGPQRAVWLSEARAWLLANKASIRGAFYFQSSSPRCAWSLTSAAEFTAFGAMAKDTVNFGG